MLNSGFFGFFLKVADSPANPVRSGQVGFGRVWSGRELIRSKSGKRKKIKAEKIKVRTQIGYGGIFYSCNIHTPRKRF